MAIARLTQNFLKLPTFYKYLGVGSLLLAISVILPWYSDLDAYKVGDIFLGLTGPASFVGIVTLLLSLISFGIFLTHLLERKKIRLPVKESVFQLFVGVETLFLLFLVNSIYFHPKFGVNILLKEVRFGMIIAFIGAVLVTIGGFIQHKKEKETDDMIGKLEPLVSMPVKEERTHSFDLERKHGGFLEKKSTASIPEVVKVKQEPLLMEEEKPSPQSPRGEAGPSGSSGPSGTGGGSYMWRP